MAVSRTPTCDAGPLVVAPPDASSTARMAASPTGWNRPDSGSATPMRDGSPGPDACTSSSKPIARRARAVSLSTLDAPEASACARRYALARAPRTARASPFAGAPSNARQAASPDIWTAICSARWRA